MSELLGSMSHGRGSVAGPEHRLSDFQPEFFLHIWLPSSSKLAHGTWPETEHIPHTQPAFMG
jgi:hypothetical protein